MRAAIIQPYFVPYLGYYSLINSAEVLVVLDSVNYTHRRWINRNQLFDGAGNQSWVTLHLESASQNRPIRDHYLSQEQTWRVALVKKLRVNAGGSAASIALVDQFEEFLSSSDRVNLSWLNTEINKALCKTIGIETIFVASDLDVDYQRDLTGQDRIISICHSLGADTYINPVGGKSIYSEGKFAVNDVKLEFLTPHFGSLAERIRNASIVQILSEIPLNRIAGIIREVSR